MRVLGRICEWLIALTIVGAAGILLGPWLVVETFRLLVIYFPWS